MGSYIYKPDQKVSISAKQKEDWYIQNIEYWIAKAISLNNKKFTKDCIDAANGIISDDVFKYVLNPLQMDEDKMKKLDKDQEVMLRKNWLLKKWSLTEKLIEETKEKNKDNKELIFKDSFSFNESLFA